MSNGPSPALVHFLQNVHHLPPESKVKILGCIQSYTPSTGLITLQHRPSIDIPLPQLLPSVLEYSATPQTSFSPPQSPPRVSQETEHSAAEPSTPRYTLQVSVDLILESAADTLYTKMPRLEEGTWVFIIGYTKEGGVLQGITLIPVEGSLELERYEQALLGIIEIREDVEKKVWEKRVKEAEEEAGKLE